MPAPVMKNCRMIKLNPSVDNKVHIVTIQIKDNIKCSIIKFFKLPTDDHNNN